MKPAPAHTRPARRPAPEPPRRWDVRVGPTALILFALAGLLGLLAALSGCAAVPIVALPLAGHHAAASPTPSAPAPSPSTEPPADTSTPGGIIDYLAAHGHPCATFNHGAPDTSGMLTAGCYADGRVALVATFADTSNTDTVYRQLRAGMEAKGQTGVDYAVGSGWIVMTGQESYAEAAATMIGGTLHFS